MAIETINPATGQVIERFAPRSAEDVDAALTRADVAFRAWRQRPVRERATVLGRAAAVLETEVDRFASIMTLEMGKLRSAARDEVQKCAAGCRHYAENLDHYLAEEFLQEPGGDRGAGAVPAAGADPGGHALELPVLAGDPLRRPGPGRGQRGPAEARGQRAPLRAGAGGPVSPGGRARGRVPDAADRIGRGGRRDRRRPGGGGDPDGQRARRPRGGRAPPAAT